MKMVIQIKAGFIQNILSDTAAEVLLLDYDIPLPGIDDTPAETVIDYDGNEVACNKIKSAIEPLQVNYFFGIHEAQYDIEYL